MTEILCKWINDNNKFGEQIGKSEYKIYHCLYWALIRVPYYYRSRRVSNKVFKWIFVWPNSTSIWLAGLLNISCICNTVRSFNISSFHRLT